MDDTPNLKLPYIMAAQAQKHVTHNEAIKALDAVVQLSVKSRNLTIPPANPIDGNRYIIGASATGDWSGKGEQIAAFQDNSWTYFDPAEGWLCWIADEGILLAWTGSVWSEALGGAGLTNPASMVGVNTTASSPNKLAVKSDAVLFSHDDVTPGTGDIQIKLNKSGATKNASFLFQNNWSGRAEIGLTGNENFHFKVSPNGSSWYDAIVLNKDSGAVNFSKKLSIGQNEHLANGLTISKHNPSIVIKDDETGNLHTSVISFRDGTGAEKIWCGLGSSSNSAFTFLTHYSGGLSFLTHGGRYPIKFGRSGKVPSIKVHTNGYVGILNETPTAPLDVSGAIKFGFYVVAAVPSASAMGAGSLIYVSDESGGATVAFSDGTDWRRMADRATIS